MGNRLPNYNKPIGVISECPICGINFRKEDTHGHVSSLKLFHLMRIHIEIKIPKISFLMNNEK